MLPLSHPQMRLSPHLTAARSKSSPSHSLQSHMSLDQQEQLRHQQQQQLQENDAHQHHQYEHHDSSQRPSLLPPAAPPPPPAPAPAPLGPPQDSVQQQQQRQQQPQTTIPVNPKPLNAALAIFEKSSSLSSLVISTTASLQQDLPLFSPTTERLFMYAKKQIDAHPILQQQQQQKQQPNINTSNGASHQLIPAGESSAPSVQPVGDLVNVSTTSTPRDLISSIPVTTHHTDTSSDSDSTHHHNPAISNTFLSPITSLMPTQTTSFGLSGLLGHASTRVEQPCSLHAQPRLQSVSGDEIDVAGSQGLMTGMDTGLTPSVIQPVLTTTADSLAVFDAMAATVAQVRAMPGNLTDVFDQQNLIAGGMHLPTPDLSPACIPLIKTTTDQEDASAKTKVKSATVSTISVCATYSDMTPVQVKPEYSNVMMTGINTTVTGLPIYTAYPNTVSISAPLGEPTLPYMPLPLKAAVSMTCGSGGVKTDMVSMSAIGTAMSGSMHGDGAGARFTASWPGNFLGMYAFPRVRDQIRSLAHARSGPCDVRVDVAGHDRFVYQDGGYGQDTDVVDHGIRINHESRDDDGISNNTSNSKVNNNSSRNDNSGVDVEWIPNFTGTIFDDDDLVRFSKTVSGPHICTYPNCGVRFDTFLELHSHVVTHRRITAAAKAAAHHAASISTTTHDQNMHMNHPNTNITTTTNTKSKPFRCDRCNQSFSRSHDLKRHWYVHSKDRPYVCRRCGKGFSRRDALKRHQRAVLDGKKVHCSLMETAMPLFSNDGVGTE